MAAVLARDDDQSVGWGVICVRVFVYLCKNEGSSMSISGRI